MSISSNKGDSQTALQQLEKLVEAFVDEIIAPGHERERVRKPLRLYLLRYELLKILIAHGENIELVEKQIEESTQFLEERISRIHGFLVANAKQRKSEVYSETKEAIVGFQSSVEVSTQNYLKVLPNEFLNAEKRQEFWQLSAELAKLHADVSKTSAMIEYFKVEWPLLVLETEITKKFQAFKALRKKQKRWQKIHRFLWAVIIGGFLISLVASIGLKLVLANVWLIIVGAIVTFTLAIAKEYWIGPWLRRKRVELQRKHLQSCLHDFHMAEVALLLHAPQEYVLDKLV